MVVTFTPTQRMREDVVRMRISMLRLDLDSYRGLARVYGTLAPTTPQTGLRARLDRLADDDPWGRPSDAFCDDVIAELAEQVTL